MTKFLVNFISKPISSSSYSCIGEKREVKNCSWIFVYLHLSIFIYLFYLLFCLYEYLAFSFSLYIEEYITILVQSAGAAEYTNCTSAEC